MEIAKEWYLVWFLIVLVWNILWIAQYPEEIADTLLFKADAPGWSMGFWIFISAGIGSLILYLTS